MTKKKPDFLRDLDTAIMDELTGGGIKGNAAGLVGTLTEIEAAAYELIPSNCISEMENIEARR